jgi:hypothetical protein
VCIPRACAHSFEFKIFWAGLKTLAYVYANFFSLDDKPSGSICKYIKTSIFVNTSLSIYFFTLFFYRIQNSVVDETTNIDRVGYVDSHHIVFV